MTRTNITSTPGEWTLTGITKAEGACECCTRRITQRVFSVSHPTHGTADLGRRCAAKATGYRPNVLDREIAALARIAEVARRAVIVAEQFPQQAADFAAASAAYQTGDSGRFYALMTPGAHRFQTATTEDAWWGGRGWTAYATWADYMTAS